MIKKPFRLATTFVLVAIGILLLLSACSLSELPSDSTRSPEEAIIQAVEDYLVEQGAPFDQVEVKIEQLEGNFARVQIISTDPALPGGFTGFLQRVEGGWMVLVTGSDLDPAAIQALGIPESILPEGWVFVDDEPPALPVSSLSKASVASGQEITATGCQEPGPETLLWVDEALGFCLLYPASHMVVQLESGNTEIVVGEVMNHIDPRISITSEELAGRTLAQVVDHFLQGYEGFEITRSDAMLDGQQAVLLDGIPGQDYYRVLFVAHANGLLYRLSVAPYDPTLDNIAQAEQLYALAMESFHFTLP